MCRTRSPLTSSHPTPIFNHNCIAIDEILLSYPQGAAVDLICVNKDLLGYLCGSGCGGSILSFIIRTRAGKDFCKPSSGSRVLHDQLRLYCSQVTQGNWQDAAELNHSLNSDESYVLPKDVVCAHAHTNQPEGLSFRNTEALSEAFCHGVTGSPHGQLQGF